MKAIVLLAIVLASIPAGMVSAKEAYVCSERDVMGFAYKNNAEQQTRFTPENFTMVLDENKLRVRWQQEPSDERYTCKSTITSDFMECNTDAGYYHFVFKTKDMTFYRMKALPIEGLDKIFSRGTCQKI